MPSVYLGWCACVEGPVREELETDVLFMVKRG